MTEITRESFLTILEQVMSTHGIEPEQASMLSTTAYQTQGLLNLYDQVSYANYVARREMFPSTALFVNSLYKWNKIANANIERARPSSRIFYFELNVDDMLQDAEHIGDKLYTYRIPSNTTVHIDDFVYSLDYDIVIKVFEPTGITSVTALYDTSKSNAISDIVNPNIKVIKQNRNVTLVLTLQQYQRVYKSYRYLDISTDIKTLQYDKQLINFDVYYRESEFDETPVKLDTSMYFQRVIPDNPTIYYALESGSITFLNRGYRGNFRPIRDSLIETVMYTTDGVRGNFEYISDDIKLNVTDEVDIKIKVTCESNFLTPGANEDDLETIRKKILTSLHSRESLISENDLNALFGKEGKPYKVIKTRDDLLYRIYSLYVPLYVNNKLLPSNTIDISFDYADCDNKENSNYCRIPEDTVFGVQDANRAIMLNGSSDNSIKYSLDKLFMINKPMRLVESYEKYIDRTYATEYAYSYDKSRYVYMINKINIQRHKDKQLCVKFNLMTNLNDEKILLHTVDEDGHIHDDGTVEVYLLIRDKTHSIKGYLKCSMLNYISETDLYEYGVDINTDFFIENGKMHCSLMNNNANEDVVLDTDSDIIDMIVCDGNTNTMPMSNYNIITDKHLSNIFTVNDVTLVKSYSDIMYTRMKDLTDTKKVLTDIPVIGDTFFKKHFDDIFQTLYQEYDYVSNLYMKTQANFDTSIKFANTYGMSRIHYIGNDGTLLNRVNISMTFRVGLAYNASVDFAYIRNYISNYVKDIDFLNDKTFHTSNLISDIKNDIPDLDKFEFVSINNYDTKYQYIYNKYDIDDPAIIPELINFNLDDNEDYDINLIKI